MHSRRHFLTGSVAAAGLAGPLLAAQASGHKKVTANDTIQFALIGAGGMGSGDAGTALEVGGTKLVAVADVYDGRLQHAKEAWGNDVFTTRDYREVLARNDIDAVIVATPDHWHSKISVDAMNAGKDVYCEKPMVQRIEDGPAVIEAHRRRRAASFRSAASASARSSTRRRSELIARGRDRRVNMVEAWWDRNSAIGAWQYSIPTDASPRDDGLGPLPGHARRSVPFEPVRLFRWRNYRDYGTGVAGDLFVHLFSGMHFITGLAWDRRACYATGGLRYWKDGRDVPDVLLGLYDYLKTAKHPAFNLALRVNFVNGAGETSGFRFVGSEGVLAVRQRRDAFRSSRGNPSRATRSRHSRSRSRKRS